ncbi:hypothetical protein EDD15DRAFT_2476721 [Pisolithus albus]|nr:hypothetical protein EDD15DRAFT_2476721 [Pisolithus albus]
MVTLIYIIACLLELVLGDLCWGWGGAYIDSGPCSAFSVSHSDVDDRRAGGPNIVALLGVVRVPSSKIRSSITEYIDNGADLTFATTCSSSSRRLIVVTRRMMHWDIKPHNVMIDHERQKVSVLLFQCEIDYLHVLAAATRSAALGRLLPPESDTTFGLRRTISRDWYSWLISRSVTIVWTYGALDAFGSHSQIASLKLAADVLD